MSSFDILVGDANVAVVALGVTPTYVGYSVLTEDSIGNINRLIVEDMEAGVAEWAMETLDLNEFELDDINILVDVSETKQLKPYLYTVILCEVGTEKATVVFWDDEFDYGNLKDYLTEKLAELNWSEDSFETGKFFHG